VNKNLAVLLIFI